MQIQIQGEFTEVRKTMKTLRQEKATIRRKLEKELKEKTEKKQRTDNIKNQLRQIEREINIYTFTKTWPVKVQNVLVNGKLLQDFLKKLNGFQTNLTVNDKSITLTYSKPFSSNKGELVLYDLSKYFQEITYFPTIVLKDESL